VKVRYRRPDKNANGLFVTCALISLFLVRKQLRAPSRCSTCPKPPLTASRDQGNSIPRGRMKALAAHSFYPCRSPQKYLSEVVLRLSFLGVTYIYWLLPDPYGLDFSNHFSSNHFDQAAKYFRQSKDLKARRGILERRKWLRTA